MQPSSKILVATFAYDGSAFYGSQSQPNHPSVLKSLRTAFACCGLFGKLCCASRTDKGVHALRNVVATPLPYTPQNLEILCAQLNKHLLPHILILSLRIVPQPFHARFDAKARLYRYLIMPTMPNVFQSRYVYFHPLHNPAQLMQNIKLFEGEHDFSFFAKHSTKSPIRTIDKAHAFWWNQTFVMSFLARGFLHSQIRFIVQALLEVDSDKLSLHNLREQIDCKQRHTCNLAPPNGLYLCRIYY